MRTSTPNAIVIEDRGGGEEGADGGAQAGALATPSSLPSGPTRTGTNLGVLRPDPVASDTEGSG